jgi:RecB family exonuclease
MIHFKLEGDIYFTGKIDRVDLDGRSLIIHDYKTNTKLLPDESDKVAEQINLYGLGMKELYASKVDSVRGAAHYLHFDRSYEREIDNQKLQAVKSKYLNLAREIESKKKQFALGDHDAFPCITGTHCNYCPFRQLCPARKHEYMGDEELSTSNQELSTIEDHLTLHQLIDKYKETKDEIKTLEDMLDMYKEMLVNYAVSR